MRVYRRPGFTAISIDCFADTPRERYEKNYERIFGQTRELDAILAAGDTK